MKRMYFFEGKEYIILRIMGIEMIFPLHYTSIVSS